MCLALEGRVNGGASIISSVESCTADNSSEVFIQATAKLVGKEEVSFLWTSQALFI